MTQTALEHEKPKKRLGTVRDAEVVTASKSEKPRCSPRPSADREFPVPLIEISAGLEPKSRRKATVRKLSVLSVPAVPSGTSSPVSDLRSFCDRSRRQKIVGQHSSHQVERIGRIDSSMLVLRS